LTSWTFDESKVSEEEAATIPVTLCTAADALYNKMDPVLPLPGGVVCGWPMLIWGGSSQVGVQGIQLAKQSGCNPIITTSSPKVRVLLCWS
jgi:NADPH:quinone reductase-like Zn-dependent oxidoreductase